MSEKYLTSNLILMWGTDFGHKDAETDYKIMDKIIEYIPKSRYSQFDIKYSTIDQYLKAVYEQARNENIEWPIVTKDFFPYNSHISHHSGTWSGYFSTDPMFKKQVVALSDLTHSHNLITNLDFLTREQS